MGRTKWPATYNWYFALGMQLLPALWSPFSFHLGCSYVWKKASIQGHCRAIDTSEVSLVPIANYPLARQTPTQDPHAVTHMAGDMLKLVRWLPSLQNDLFRVFLSTTFHFSKQIISLDGCRRLESQNQCCMTQWTEKVDMYTYETVLSGLWEASFVP